MTEPSAPANRPDPVYWATLAGLAIIYFAAAKFGLSLAFATKQVTAVWPPTGIALVALLLFGYRLWPAVYIGAFLANAASDEPFAGPLSAPYCGFGGWETPSAFWSFPRSC